MNVEEFRNEAKSRGGHTFSNQSYGGLEWSEWHKLATMTKNIEYGCHFGKHVRNDSTDERSTCSKQRKHNKTAERCCCDSCDTNLGYLRFIQDDQKVVKRIASLLQLKNGFWRENKGCILPRKYRSAVCLGYRCGSAGRYKIYGTEGMLVLLMDSIRIRRLSDKSIRILGRALLKSA